MQNSRGTRNQRAFTLVELIVVIGIIAILAALLFPAMAGVNRMKLVSRARGELAVVNSCIAAYKEKLGFYPPDNRDPLDNQVLPGRNQLYYELAGTMVSGNTFITKDRTGPALTSEMIKTFFGPGVVGFINSDRGSADEGPVAVQLLKNLKPGLVADTTVSNAATKLTVTARILVCTVRGTDPNNPPLNNGSPALNPWRYNSSSPTNNSGTYDLWTDILVSGKPLRICNWSSKVIVVKE